ncbi:MAG: hypothetical protein N2559_08850, partial [Anaerolineae bacterium]|nr:hypothetical protein [Anaerolineae bacterium]
MRALWGEATKIDRKSDLYVYFYYVGLSLLREGGIFCFINSNSWLDVDYGAELQEFLLRQTRILQIIDNHSERSFEQADVNTVIVLLQRPQTADNRSQTAVGEQWSAVAKFVAYKKPFEEVLTVPNLLAIERATEITRTDDYRVYPITQRELFIEGAEDSHPALSLVGEGQEGVETLKYTGGKWGGKYLRAPDIFFKILEKGKGKLVRLEEIAEVRRGFTTGANEFFYLEDITNETRERLPRAGLRYCRNGAGWEGWLEEEFLKPVIKSPREVRGIIVRPDELRYKIFMCHKTKPQLKADDNTHALAYITWGEKQEYHKRPTCRGRARWWDLGQQERQDFIMLRFRDLR